MIPDEQEGTPTMKQVHCEVCNKVYDPADYDGPEDANEAFLNDHGGKLLPQGTRIERE